MYALLYSVGFGAWDMYSDTLDKLFVHKLCSEEGIDFEKLIDGIVLAPRSEQNELELKEYLETLGYKEISKKITKSQCPLR